MAAAHNIGATGGRSSRFRSLVRTEQRQCDVIDHVDDEGFVERLAADQQPVEHDRGEYLDEGVGAGGRARSPRATARSTRIRHDRRLSSYDAARIASASSGSRTCAVITAATSRPSSEPSRSTKLRQPANRSPRSDPVSGQWHSGGVRRGRLERVDGLQGINHERRLAGPPPVHRGLARLRLSGHRVDGEPVVADPAEHLERRRQDDGVARVVARASRVLDRCDVRGGGLDLGTCLQSSKRYGSVSNTVPGRIQKRNRFVSLFFGRDTLSIYLCRGPATVESYRSARARRRVLVERARDRGPSGRPRVRRGRGDRPLDEPGQAGRYCLATRGEAGIDSLPRAGRTVAREEQRASAAIVGVDGVEFLDYPDGTIEYGLPLRRDVARAVRRHRPDVVISGNHHDSWGPGIPNQADHIAVGRAVARRGARRRQPMGVPRVARRGHRALARRCCSSPAARTRPMAST